MPIQAVFRDELMEIEASIFWRLQAKAGAKCTNLELPVFWGGTYHVERESDIYDAAPL